MYEEGQLYSPATTDEHGGIIGQLAHDHPGANDLRSRGATEAGVR